MPIRSFAFGSSEPPKPQSWRCNFCNHDVMLRENDTKEGATVMPHHGDETGECVRVTITRCTNSKCGKLEVAVSILNGKLIHMEDSNEPFIFSGEKVKSTWRLQPESSAKSFPNCIPEVILIDYREACLIRDRSPKASATLSRRALQGMISDFWGIKPEGATKTLYKQIDALKKQIDSGIWGAIDALRQIGNIGAHMEADINVIVDVEPDEATLLIGLLELLFQEWYIARDDRDKRLKAITALPVGKKTPANTPSISPPSPAPPSSPSP